MEAATGVAAAVARCQATRAGVQEEVQEQEEQEQGDNRLPMRPGQRRRLHTQEGEAMEQPRQVEATLEVTAVAPVRWGREEGTEPPGEEAMVAEVVTFRAN